jgi:Flp pilus assembly protein TadG
MSYLFDFLRHSFRNREDSMPIRLRSLEDTARRFSADDHGNVAMMLAIAAIPVLGAAGAAIDYSRAIQARGELQRAVDAAALAAAKISDASTGEKKKLVNSLLQNQLSNMALMAMQPKIEFSEPEKGKVKVVVDAAVATSLIKILNFDRMDISAAAVAVSPSEAEVALALDTTGSMKNDMGTLRATATKFVQTLFHASPGQDSLRISVVPYVAAVNPGRRLLLDAGAVDVTGQSSWNANDFRNRLLASMATETKSG